ncbi:hypothetical protein IF1G_00516 [Cordyceps javanica]|uniref:Uncharacterized protein n=1 Tax=Cordyceps javanica TaxID=43265 RepID=A0A545VFS4_9HYPO|nr:hypothetical protein IF1G_00516 [Cordyceps javanica]
MTPTLDVALQICDSPRTAPAISALIRTSLWGRAPPRDPEPVMLQFRHPFYASHPVVSRPWQARTSRAAAQDIATELGHCLEVIHPGKSAKVFRAIHSETRGHDAAAPSEDESRHWRVLVRDLSGESAGRWQATHLRFPRFVRQTAVALRLLSYDPAGCGPIGYSLTRRSGTATNAPEDGQLCNWRNMVIVLAIAAKSQHSVTKREGCGLFRRRLKQEVDVKVPFPGATLHHGLKVLLRGWRSRLDLSHDKIRVLLEFGRRIPKFCRRKVCFPDAKCRSEPLIKWQQKVFLARHLIMCKVRGPRDEQPR